MMTITGCNLQPILRSPRARYGPRGARNGTACVLNKKMVIEAFETHPPRLARRKRGWTTNDQWKICNQWQQVPRMPLLDGALPISRQVRPVPLRPLLVGKPSSSDNQ